MAATSLALPVIQAIALLKFAINFVFGESFPVQKIVAMTASSFYRTLAYELPFLSADDPTIAQGKKLRNTENAIKTGVRFEGIFEYVW